MGWEDQILDPETQDKTIRQLERRNGPVVVHDASVCGDNSPTITIFLNAWTVVLIPLNGL